MALRNGSAGRFTSLCGMAVALGVVFAPTAAADPGHGQPGRPDPATPISDFGDENYGMTDEALADLTMADSCKDANSTTGLCYDSTNDALIPPETGAGTVSCAMVAHNDRTNSGPPADSTYMVNAYLVPTDATVRNFDRPTVCDSGTVSESNIGRSNYNTRRWMYVYSGGTNGGKSLETRKRTVTAYGTPFAVIDVPLVKLSNNLAYYAADHWTRLENEMIQRGWNQTYAKYAFYADLRPTADTTGTTPAGQAGYGGKRAYSFRRVLYKNTARIARWGCGDEGDNPAMHEQFHLFSLVNPTAPDYSAGPDGKSPYHAAQTNDVMHYVIKSTLSGYWSNGVAATRSAFDPGSDTYKTSIFGRTSYVLGSPGSRTMYVC